MRSKEVYDISSVVDSYSKHGTSMNIRPVSRADTKSTICQECKRFDSLTRILDSF